jgi:hypothetical protein
MTRDELIALAKETALAHQLDPLLVCAIVEQESSWETFAIRSESKSGFSERYGVAYQKIVASSASKTDDRWIKFEDIFYCSYGLMQTLYCVIIETFPEQTSALTFPTMLCDPYVGLELGCRLFKKKLSRAAGDTRTALLYWNGGGRPAYADEVLSRKDKYS